MVHANKSLHAKKVLKIKVDVKHFQYPDFGGSDFCVEDWWDRIAGKSWMDSGGNIACMVYARRVRELNLPMDDEVLYGKVGSYGSLVHISELKI